MDNVSNIDVKLKYPHIYCFVAYNGNEIMRLQETGF